MFALLLFEFVNVPKPILPVVGVLGRDSFS
jgi:hypothetical protein